MRSVKRQDLLSKFVRCVDNIDLIFLEGRVLFSRASETECLCSAMLSHVYEMKHVRLIYSSSPLLLVIVDTTAAPAMQSAALFLFANYYSRYRMC